MGKSRRSGAARKRRQKNWWDLRSTVERNAKSMGDGVGFVNNYSYQEVEARYWSEEWEETHVVKLRKVEVSQEEEVEEEVIIAEDTNVPSSEDSELEKRTSRKTLPIASKKLKGVKYGWDWQRDSSRSLVKQKIKMASKVVSKVLADKEKVERLENTPPTAFACNDSLWPGCLVDSHCHLNLVHRRLELAEGLPQGSLITLQDSTRRDGQDIQSEAVGGVITNLHQPRDWWLFHQYQKQVPDEKRVLYAIGCHPKHATLLSSARLRKLEELVQEPGVVAVGECGLDYSARSYADKKLQEFAFLAQIRLALRHSLPLVLHIRDVEEARDGGDAEQDCYRILKEAKVPKDYPIHRHCFNGDVRSASDWLHTFPGSKIGLTALVTYPKATHLQEVAKMIPLHRLLLETDAPYFAPSASSSVLPNFVMMKNPLAKIDFAQPSHVLQVAAAVAKLKGITIKQVLLANLKNVSEVYKVDLAAIEQF